MNYSEEEVNGMLWILRDQKGLMEHETHRTLFMCETAIKNGETTMQVLERLNYLKMRITSINKWEDICGISIPSYFINYYTSVIIKMRTGKHSQIVLEDYDRKRQMLHKLILLYARKEHGSDWDNLFQKEIEKRIPTQEV